MEDLIHCLNTMDWSNIQEPVKILVSSMVEVILKQRNDIEELKANSGIVASSFHKESTKNDATKSNCDSLMTKVESVEKMNIENKLSMKDIRLEVDNYCDKIDTIKKKLDDYTSAMQSIERNISASVEANFSDKLQDIHNKLKLIEILHAKSSISKDELYALLSQKAQLSDLESTNEAMQSCVAKNELQKELNFQILPLTKALSSLEKLIQIHSSTKSEPIKVYTDTPVFDVKLIENIVNTTILERNFCESKSVDVHSLITEIYERVLAEIRSSGEVLRLDLVATFNSEIAQYVDVMESKIKYSEAKVLEKFKKIATKFSQVIDKVVTKNDFEKWQNCNMSKQHVSFDQRLFQNDVQGNDNLAHHFDSFSEYSNILDKSVIANGTNKLHREINELRIQLNDTKRSIGDFISNQRKENNVHNTTTTPEEWRLAIGDLTSNIRGEMKEKIDRGEMLSIINNVITKDLNDISGHIDGVKNVLETKTNVETTGLLQEELTALTKRFVSNFAEGRWVCTNHNNLCIRDDGIILWDSEMYNSVPSMFPFKKMNSYLQVKAPGLYRLNCTIFSNYSIISQIYLNGEIIISNTNNNYDNNNSKINKENDNCTQRFQHSAGVITGLNIDENLSLPTNGCISLKVISESADFRKVQAYISLKKL